MTGVVNGFRWALLGTGNGPDHYILDLHCHFHPDLHFRAFLFPQHGKDGKDVCGYDLKHYDNSNQCKNLGKRYQIGAAETKFRYNMLRDVLVDTVYAPVRLAKALVGKSDRRSNQNFVWALKDVPLMSKKAGCSALSGATARGKARCSRSCRA
jgi:hypothetical protein